MPDLSSPGRGASQRCAFLLTHEEEKLRIVFCNYASLGQMELARAVMQRLFATAAAEALKILDHLIFHG